MNRLPADRAASQAALLTAARPFMNLSSEGKKLFQVMPGLPIVDVLEQASTFLAIANSLLTDGIPMQSEADDRHYAALHFIETAKALVDSVTSAMMKGGVR